MSAQKKHIFITARYRTGSSYLYSLFSDVDDVAAFYEPLHPKLQKILETEDEKWHQNQRMIISLPIKNQLFEEYRCLDRESLKRLHHERFSHENLILSKNDSFDELKEYIDFLLSSHPEKIKVLQFNRVDFRLDWLRSNFQDALIVNLRRNPRDMYVSYLETHARRQEQSNKEFSIDDSVGHLFYLDLYTDLLGGSAIPQFLAHELNSYEKIYLLNRLSNLWADKFADLIITYDALVSNPVNVLEQVLSRVGETELKFKDELVSPKKDRIETWRAYHSDEWYSVSETKCEQLLTGIVDKLLLAGFL